jgi:hypothetical protein
VCPWKTGLLPAPLELLKLSTQGLVAGGQRGDLALQLSDQRQPLLTTHRWVVFELTHGMQ